MPWPEIQFRLRKSIHPNKQQGGTLTNNNGVYRCLRRQNDAELLSRERRGTGKPGHPTAPS
ncbi:hypothetical protein [Synechococcus sp. SYN20]|uniref:hypothetical protein n=1 Tax=Synechococcus sp. SYN20 TaxID=1050714 RepID=UPI0016462652|nr:hypothetical protein [Synechococcus sp. SYN20]